MKIKFIRQPVSAILLFVSIIACQACDELQDKKPVIVKNSPSEKIVPLSYEFTMEVSGLPKQGGAGYSLVLNCIQEYCKALNPTSRFPGLTSADYRAYRHFSCAGDMLAGIADGVKPVVLYSHPDILPPNTTFTMPQACSKELAGGETFTTLTFAPLESIDQKAEMRELAILAYYQALAQIKAIATSPTRKTVHDNLFSTYDLWFEGKEGSTGEDLTRQMYAAFPTIVGAINDLKENNIEEAAQEGAYKRDNWSSQTHGRTRAMGQLYQQPIALTDDNSVTLVGGVYWDRCPIGMSWTAAGCSGAPVAAAWDVQKKACEAQGKRLPTADEFAVLLTSPEDGQGACDWQTEDECANCTPTLSICNAAIPTHKIYYHYTSNEVDATQAISVRPRVTTQEHFRIDSKTAGRYVRCVRSAVPSVDVLPRQNMTLPDMTNSLQAGIRLLAETKINFPYFVKQADAGTPVYDVMLGVVLDRINQERSQLGLVSYPEISQLADDRGTSADDIVLAADYMYTHVLLFPRALTVSRRGTDETKHLTGWDSKFTELPPAYFLRNVEPPSASGVIPASPVVGVGGRVAGTGIAHLSRGIRQVVTDITASMSAAQTTDLTADEKRVFMSYIADGGKGPGGDSTEKRIEYSIVTLEELEEAKEIRFTAFNPTLAPSMSMSDPVVADRVALFPIGVPEDLEKRFANMLCFRDANCPDFWFYLVDFATDESTGGGHAQASLSVCTYTASTENPEDLELGCTEAPSLVMNDLYWIIEHTTSVDLDNATWKPVGYVERDKWDTGEVYLEGLVFDALETMAMPSPEDLNAAQCDAMSDLHGRCIDRNWVPALENELTSDSDQYEDSYRYYLDQSRLAANEAASARESVLSDLIEEAQDTALIEAQLDQSEDIYLDAMREICGDAVKDDEFLAAVETAHAQGKTGDDFATEVANQLAQNYGCAFNAAAPVDDSETADVEKVGPVHCRAERNCSVETAVTLGNLGLFDEALGPHKIVVEPAASPDPGEVGWAEPWGLPGPEYESGGTRESDIAVIEGATFSMICPTISLNQLVDPTVFFASADGNSARKIFLMRCWAKQYRAFVEGRMRATRLPYLPNVIWDFASASEGGLYEDFFNTDIATGLGMSYGQYYEQLLKLSEDIDGLRSIGATYEGHFEHSMAVLDRIALLVKAADTSNELLLAEKLGEAQIASSQFETQTNQQYQECLEQELAPFGGIDSPDLKDGIRSVLVAMNLYFFNHRGGIDDRDDADDFQRECENAMIDRGINSEYGELICRVLADNWFGRKIEDMIDIVSNECQSAIDPEYEGLHVDPFHGYFMCESIYGQQTCTYSKTMSEGGGINVDSFDAVIRGACEDDLPGYNGNWYGFWLDGCDNNDLDWTFNAVCKYNEKFWFYIDETKTSMLADELHVDVKGKAFNSCSLYSFGEMLEDNNSLASQYKSRTDKWSDSPPGEYYLLATLAQELTEKAEMAGLVDQMIQTGINLSTARYELAQKMKDLAADVSELSRLEDRQVSLFNTFKNGADVAEASSYSSLAEWQDRFDFRKKEYQRLLKRARLAAWIARRSIEFRFGVDLSAESTPTTYGDIPAEWADDIYHTATSVCGEGDDDPETSTVADCLTPENLIEQYVQKLEDYVDSYGSNPNTDWWFHEDNDTAVVSMRDHISITALNCDKTVDNLLFFSEDLDADPGEYMGLELDVSPCFWEVSPEVVLTPDDETLGLPPAVVAAHYTNELGVFADQVETRTADRVESAPTAGLRIWQSIDHADAVAAIGSEFNTEAFSVYLRSLPQQDATMCDTEAGELFFPALGRCGVSCEVNETYGAPWGTCGAEWPAGMERPVCMIAGYDLTEDPSSEYVRMCDWCTADRGCVYQDGQAVALTLVDDASTVAAEARTTVYPYWTRHSVNTIDHAVGNVRFTGSGYMLAAGVNSIQTKNLYPTSENIDGESWTDDYNTGVSFLYRDAFVAPDGSVPSDGVSIEAANAIFGFEWQRGTSSAGYYTVSLWVRGPDGVFVPDVLLTLRNGSSTQIGGARFDLTQDWTRVEVNGKLAAEDSRLYVQFQRQDGEEWAVGSVVGVWGIQVEKGRGATPYMPNGKNLIAWSNNFSNWAMGSAETEFTTGVRGPNNRFLTNEDDWGIWKLFDSTSEALFRSSLPSSMAIQSGTQGTFSVWLKNANPGTDTAGIQIIEGETADAPVAVTVDQIWRRYSVTRAWTVNAPGIGQIYPADPSDPTDTGAVYVWGAQLERTTSGSTSPSGYQETGSAIAAAARDWGLNVGMVGAQLEPVSALQCDAWGDMDTTVGEFTEAIYAGDQAECCADPMNWDQTLCPDDHDGFYWHCMHCEFDAGTPDSCSTGQPCSALANVCQPEYFASSSEMGNPTIECAGGTEGYTRNTYLREHVSPFCSVDVGSAEDLPSPGDIYGVSNTDTRIQLFRGHFSSVKASEDTPPYHAYQFVLNMDAIDGGAWGQFGIIAPGNFNHRITTVAVNMVGTDVLDCSLAESPSTCAANPWVSYDLKQMGNVYIRNHHEEYNVQPFQVPTGVIKGGKAWTAEQVIGYPISGAHQTMLMQIEKVALMGRPLQGVFELRIYETPEMIWDNVEDVQIVLGVHYWSKSE